MNSLVGTPDYVAIEILKNTGYDKTVDWWSVGVIFYECLMGYPPFYAEDVNTVCQKIVAYQKTLVIPEKYTISENARKLIFSLIIVPEQRLSFPEIKSHPFFANVPWGNLRTLKPPFLPQLDNAEDTRYFDIEEEEHQIDISSTDPEELFKLNEYQPRTVTDEVPFMDFTFVRSKSKRTGLDGLFEEIIESDEDPDDPVPANVVIHRVTEGGVEIFGATGVNKELINGKFLPHKTLKHEGISVWKRIDIALVLWYWKKRGVWMLTRERDLGTDRVYCVVRCDSTNPAHIDSSFFIWNPQQKKLVPDGSVQVRQFSLEIFE